MLAVTSLTVEENAWLGADRRSVPLEPDGTDRSLDRGHMLAVAAD
jgi:hypothetical protein